MASCLPGWVAWPFWIIAVAASGWYGRHAVEAFVEAPYPDYAIPRETKNRTWRYHQAWFNFLGALVGWFALWSLLPGICSVFRGRVPDLTWSATIRSVLAFAGITGHLPFVFMTSVAGLAGILKSVIEIASRAVGR